jgi:hypothetical protein
MDLKQVNGARLAVAFQTLQLTLLAHCKFSMRHWHVERRMEWCDCGIFAVGKSIAVSLDIPDLFRHYSSMMHT